MVELEKRFPEVRFYNPRLTEIQARVSIGPGSRIGTFTLIHQGAQIGLRVTIGSHCNICDCRIGNRVSIQTACHITRGVIIEDDVFIGPGVITVNDTFKGDSLFFPRICQGAKIGGGSVILPGITVGEKAIVGAGSVVTRDVEPGGLVLGSPAIARVRSSL